MIGPWRKMRIGVAVLTGDHIHISFPGVSRLTLNANRRTWTTSEQRRALLAFKINKASSTSQVWMRTMRSRKA